MSRNHHRRLLGLSFLVLALAGRGEALAARPSTVAGKLVSLSPAAQTVALQRADGTQVVLRATPRSLLLRNGARVRLAGLALRDGVVARFDPASLRVQRLEARGPAVTSIRGTLAAFDAAHHVLRLATPAGERSFRVNPQTLMVRNGQPARAADLTPHDALLVHARVNAAPAPMALDVAADGPEKEEVEGEITALAGNDVTITPGGGAPVTVHADDATEIVLEEDGEDAPATLADLAVGMEAEAEFDPVSFVAFEIEAELEEDDPEEPEEAEVEGEVTAVDAAAKTLTIDPEHGAPVVVTVDADTLITRDGAAATLADIQVGDEAEAEFDPDTLVAEKVAAESEGDGDGEGHDEGDEGEEAEVEGEVTAISASSITIDPEDGPPVTLAIDAATEIEVDDAPATAADIQVGDEAEAEYDPDTLVATEIEVEDDD